jgi:hypothetical protein
MKQIKCLLSLLILLLVFSLPGCTKRIVTTYAIKDVPKTSIFYNGEEFPDSKWMIVDREKEDKLLRSVVKWKDCCQECLEREKRIINK